MKYIVFLFCFCNLSFLFAQVHEDKSVCKINCDKEINKENAKVISSKMQSGNLAKLLAKAKKTNFPIRFVYVEDGTFESINVRKKKIKGVLKNLNKAFKKTKFKFSTHTIEVLQSTLFIEDLSRNDRNIYVEFSNKHDLEDVITVFILDHAKDFCTFTGNSISCSRTGGFSFILSTLTNNVVISKFDLEDPKIVAHEMGHFFGLYHTFEEDMFGKDNFSAQDCNTTGDCLCDTPPDPGTVFETYVNYSTCEMIGFTDENDNEYKPMLENFMSYYKPCYLTKYKFTPQQIMVMKLAGQLEIRKKFSEN